MLKGADELRHRLDAAANSADGIGADWGDAVLRNARASITVRTGDTRASLHVETGGDGARLIGNKAAIILDRGARAHDITAQGGTLRWSQGATVRFAKKVHKPPQVARPYLADAAHDAFDDVGADAIVDAWNGAA